jgi:hypothetical protein
MKKQIAPGLMCFLVACATPDEKIDGQHPSFGEASSAVVTIGGNDYYSLVNLASGRCMDVSNGSTEYHAIVQQYRCNGGANQNFRFNCMNSSCTEIEIRPQHSNYCLELKSDDLMQEACSSTSKQHRFFLDSVFGIPSNTRHVVRLRSAARWGTSDECVDLPSGHEGNGWPLQRFGCHDGANQRWLLVPRYDKPSTLGFGGPET